METEDIDKKKDPELSSRTVSNGKHRQKNRTFRSVFENTGTGTVLIEADMTISMANSGFESVTGLPRQSIEDRMRLTDFIYPGDCKRIEDYHFGRIEGRDVPGDYQCRLTGNGKGLRYMAVKAQLIDGTDRSVLSFMDITDLIRSKKELKRNERRLANLMNRLPGMAYRWEGETPYSLEFVSRGCLRLTGYQPSRLTGQVPAYTELIHPEDREQVLESINRALRDGQSFELTYRIRTASEKETWVWDRGAGTRSEKGDAFAVEGFVADFSLYKEMEQRFKKREEHLINENKRLRSTASGICGLCDLVGKSKPMQRIYELIRQASSIDNGAVLYGESGTGKELAARCIHHLSDRCGGPFVVVNCGAVPEPIFESEFFGYRKGAFSGADKDTEGFLDVADGGTLFLDEVGEISLSGQVKLLRVIDNGSYTPVGGRQEKKPDLRIIAATNRDLKAMVEKGAMREDFFFRIHVFPIRMPPLRARKEDIPLLIDRLCIDSDSPDFTDMSSFSNEALARIMAYDWPGNVRELQNAIQRYITTRNLDFLSSDTPSTCPGSFNDPTEDMDTTLPLKVCMQKIEKRYILQVLEKNQWHRSITAKMLGIDRKTLLRKIRNLDIG